MTPTENVKLIGAMTTARPGGGEFDSACIATNDMMVGGNNVPFLDSHGGHHSAAVVMNQWCNDEALNSIAGGKRTGDPMVQCLQQHDIVGSLVQYQPASRMGTFHLIENGMNLGLLVVSLLVAWWCVRRTRTTT
jgi:hypothetical protein